MNGLTTAQRNYDRQQPDSYYEPEVTRMPFSDTDVDMFIYELSTSSDPVKLLEDCGNNVDDNIGLMLQAIAKTWKRAQMDVHAVIGIYFWRVMKAAALEQYNG